MDSKPKNIGIALSGGGSKGIAHAGALQFLDEQKMKPSIISGTSAGAIIAAMYSFGKTPAEILSFFQSIYFFNWKHFTLKKAGIIDSDSFRVYFNAIFKDTKIGDLPIPIKITATDLVKGKLKVFNDNTKVTDAILASAAFPGVLSPYKINERLYSDGGILNHFPTDLLLGNCENIIGIYVSPIQNIENKDLNSIKSITSRAFDLLSAQGNYQKFSLCDTIIEPKELANYSTFETSKSKMKTIFQIGYDEAKSTFEELSS
ncbi:MULTISPECIES: patatin-like phospholipase family protein [Flavobacterium]|uniref:Patatin-like phospholipase family protein n=1 Tax=Flavobacterium jumunjinense TaxID=998845 RepID=A0ABV5GLH0_9FLAO|nr:MULTISPECIES: patatin-like phospholipase family protein [Flavobacterium]